MYWKRGQMGVSHNKEMFEDGQGILTRSKYWGRSLANMLAVFSLSSEGLIITAFPKQSKKQNSII